MLRFLIICLVFLISNVGLAGKSFDIQLLKIAPGANNILSTETGDVNEHKRLNMGLLFDYAHKPLSLYVGDDERCTIIKHRMNYAFYASLGLFDIFDIGFITPFAYQYGFNGKKFYDNTGVSLSKPERASFGDIRVVPKLRLVNLDVFDVAVVVPFTMPTGNAKSFSGEHGLLFSPSIAVSSNIGILKVASNVGYLFRKKTSLYNLNIGNEILFKSALMLKLLEQVNPFIEIHGRTSDSNPFELSHDKVSPISPFELDVGIKGHLMRNISFIAGYGVGLASGYNSPVYRIFVGVGLDTRTPLPKKIDDDIDKDGIVNEKDLCVSIPEDFDNFEDLDGCPEYDNDNDSVLDVDDMCPNTPKDKTHLVQIDGCALDLSTIEFEFNSAKLKDGSYEALDHIVFLLGYRDFLMVRIEGHTDSVGPEKYNQKLSERRAKAVLDYLVDKGANSERMESVGFGESKPIASNKTARGRKANRRVEFIVIKIK